MLNANGGGAAVRKGKGSVTRIDKRIVGSDLVRSFSRAVASRASIYRNVIRGISTLLVTGAAGSEKPSHRKGHWPYFYAYVLLRRALPPEEGVKLSESSFLNDNGSRHGCVRIPTVAVF